MAIIGFYLCSSVFLASLDASAVPNILSVRCKNMRKCPSCNIELKEVQYHKQVIDMCSACGGAFFDHGELESIVQIVDIFKDIRLLEKEIDTVSRHEKERILLCPECGVELDPKEIAGEIIDICPDCRGIWLDKGEIIALKIAENHIKEYLNLYIRLAD